MSLPPSQNMLLNSTSITYRNAVYEGQINQEKQTRKDFGIVYIAKTHEFICCNNWHNDNLEGECLFYNDHKQYVYGTWINNLPQGFNVFRFDQILLMAVFNRGKLSKNSRVLIIFEKYNLAAILLVLNDSDKLDDLELQVFSKAQVFSPEDVNVLFRQCNWSHDYFIQNQTLIKYISHKLTRPPVKYQIPSKSQAKLRLIEDKYYRFGFDQGLAIVFDQDFYRISVGCHSKNKLKSYGIVFDKKPKPLTPYNKPQQGKIIKITSKNTATKDNIKPQSKKQQQNSQQNLKTNLLMGVNFCNKFFKNPSKIFVSYIQNIISQQSIKKIIAGSLTTRRMFEQSLDFSKIQENHDLSSDILERDLKKPHVIAPITHERQKTQKSDKQKVTGDRLRLEAIKKQIYDSLQKRKLTIENNMNDDEFSREIIHKQFVGSNFKYRMETPSRTQKSKSRRRIFEESEKNLKLLRDFTPSRSEPSLTPFKVKMKNRIFNGVDSKNSLGNKNNSYESYGQHPEKHQRRQIFENEETQINQRNYELYDLNFDQHDRNFDQRDSKFQQSGRNFENHRPNNFQSKQSKGRQYRSKGKIRDTRNRDSELGNQDQRTHHKHEDHRHATYDRHVTFQNRPQNRDSLNVNDNLKQTFQSGKNMQYVPIDSNEQRQRKRSIQNHSSHKQSRQSHRNQSNKPREFHKDHNLEYQGQQNERRVTPKSKYYLEQKSSRNMDSKSFVNQNNQFRKQQHLSPQNIKKEYQRQYHMEEGRQRQNKKGRQRQNEREYRQRERQRDNRQRERQEQNFIYQDDTFKQTTLPEEFESNKLLRERQADHNDKHRRSAFRNSNQVYLQQLKQKYSPIKSTQTYTNYNKYNNPTNRTMPYMLPINENRSNSKDNYNNSYRVKHMMKKSMEKEISKSPDKIRCYGKNMNNPYIQPSPKYSKQGTYMLTYNNYESPHMLSRNEGYNMSSTGLNTRGRLF